MKLLFVIDSFGSGGAQRQIVNLAVGLKKRGHDVNFFNYYPELNFFRQKVESEAIKIFDNHKVKKGFSINTLVSLKRLLKKENYDLALSFLDTPSIYLLLAGAAGKTKLVVSDRSSFLLFNRFLHALKRQIFRFADAIVTNSHAQSNWLINNVYLSANKVFTIYNGFPCNFVQHNACFPEISRDLSLIAIGRVNPVKNLENLILALGLFEKKYGWVPKLTWVGRTDSIAYKEMIDSLLATRPKIRQAWFWLDEQDDIYGLMGMHHALILPSFGEGLPNVICEALIAGKPVLASNICDNPVLVEDGVRGYLFNPNDPSSIVGAIEKLINLAHNEWMKLSDNATKYAKENLNMEKMLDQYEELFMGLLE